MRLHERNGHAEPVEKAVEKVSIACQNRLRDMSWESVVGELSIRLGVQNGELNTVHVGTTAHGLKSNCLQERVSRAMRLIEHVVRESLEEALTPGFYGALEFRFESVNGSLSLVGVFNERCYRA